MRACFVVLAALAASLSTAVAQPSPKPLTLDDRVNAERAIQQVYWENREWPASNKERKPDFSTVTSDAILRSEVEGTLRKSDALARFWTRPVTDEQLQAELNRMVRESHNPRALRSIFRALGDDPRLIAEVFARRFLADRLIRSAYAYDRRVHAPTRVRAERFLAKSGESHEPGLAGIVSEVTYRVGPSREKSLPDETVVDLDPGQWQNVLMHIANRLGIHDRADDFKLESLPLRRWSEIEESEDDFSSVSISSTSNGELTIAVMAWPKTPFDTWWTQVSSSFATTGSTTNSEFTLPALRAPSSNCADDTWRDTLSDRPAPRWAHTAVWTGSEMIVWGGKGPYGSRTVDFPLRNTGYRYDPTTDTWKSVSLIGAPSPRAGHTAVWTGTEMIIWGGDSFGTGARYNPTSDSWSSMSTVDAPTNSTGHVGVWTGTELIVWGGGGSSSGARYNPVTDHWSTLSEIDAPCGRTRAAATWTGSEMFVWSGDEACAQQSGGLYDPISDSWRPVSSDGGPTKTYGYGHFPRRTALMTSSGVFVSLFGDIGSTAYGVYDLVSGSWRPASPDIGQFDVAVWTGRYVFTFGAVQWTNGGLFDPLTGTWQIANVADSAIQSSAVWAGSEVILWGGLHWGTYTARDRGWRYSPSLDSSVPVGMGSTPEGRTLHSAIWTGNEMIVWGGFRDWIGDGMQGRPIDTGGYYFPAANAWTPSSMIGAPTPRDSHTAVWTGTRMAVWGGNGTARAVQIFDSCYGSDFGDAGALLDPLNNSWSPMSSQSAPPARAAHSAVWTGVEMVVWGGCNRFGEEQTGGRYNPVSDHWMPTSVENAPTSRIRHSAVWTGQEMIVWGGGTENAGGTPRGGARYSPSLDSWHPVSGIDAASTSGTPAVIWSGRNMYVWNGPSQASGRYDPTLDSWQPLQTTGAPTRTARRRGVWTGREMLVEAGRYDAAFDSWRSKSIANEARVGDWSTSVWTGQEEIVWGGFIDGCEAVSTGGAYCAATPLPIADAGPDQLVECTSPEGAIAHLDGSRSSDPESLPLSFRWFAPVPLDNLFSATPTGQFPLGSTSARLTVSTAGGLSAEDDTVIVVRDSTPPTGHVLFPARGACFGPAAIPLTVRDDFADSCDPSFTKTYDPPGGPIYRDHGDYTLNVSASDQSGNVGTASTNFTIDLIAPQVTTFQPSTQVAVPGLVPFSELFAASDSDGASGEVVHESAYVNGCLAFDGSTYGDHDGLLEDDNLTADLPTLCSIMKRCGLPSLGNVSLRFEAADCGGNVGMATRELSFVPAVTPRTCDIQLLLSHEEGGASLTWSPLDGAKSFDLIRGEVAQLGSRGNQVDLGVVTCLATRTGHMTHADGIAPLAGTAYFYLVRSTSEQGPESYGSSSEGTLRVPAAGDCTM